MPAGGARADPGRYPERQIERVGALDRLFGEFGFRFHLAFGRDLRPRPALPGEVAAHAARFRQEIGAGPLAAQVPSLRYRLRRDGLAGERLAESFGIACAALSAEVEPPAAPALDAAAALVRGGIVDLADADARWQALVLAASAFALCGVPVHLFTASDARASAAARLLSAPLGALGLQAAYVAQGMDAAARRAAYAAPVVCGPLRVIAMDYLRDRMRLGRRQRPLQGRLERIASGAPDGQLMLSGLRCALIEDADLTLIDDSRVPMLVSTEGAAGAPGDRTLYEQALELARALQSPADFALEDGTRVMLQARGRQHLAQLSLLLGGAWTAPQSREELVTTALTALHALQRGRDYEVAQEAVQLQPGGQPPPSALLRLLEAKEGVPFGGRRETLARLSVPSFFRRYLRLAGTCSDAAGLETELWSLYGLRAARAGWRLKPHGRRLRVFATSEARRAAITAAAREQVARGGAALVALRTVKEGEAIALALRAAGMETAAVQGAASLSVLERAGSVLLSLHPAQRGLARFAGDVPVHVIVAELHESARHVTQIARAYAAASSEQFLALDDAAVAPYLGRLAGRLARTADASGELPVAQAARAAARAQRAAERAARRERTDLAMREQSLEELLAFSGGAA
jgi:preprotein translocase subunit SecA